MLDNPESKALFDGRITTCKDAQKQVLHYRLLIGLAEVGKPPGTTSPRGRSVSFTPRSFSNRVTSDGEIEAGGVSKGSYWLNNAKLIDEGGETKTKPQKQMIFKTQATEEDLSGFKKGDNAPREVLGKGVGDTLKSMTGLDFGIPDTHLIRIDATRLPGMDPELVKTEGKSGEMLGSSQQFRQAAARS